MDVIIRNASEKDSEDVIRLLEQLWPNRELDKDKQRNTFVASLNEKNDFLFCSEYGGKVVGFCGGTTFNSFNSSGKLCHLTTLIVDNGNRNLRIGSKMVDHLKEWARDNGCVTVELDTALYRLDAHRFYEREGFAKRAFTYSYSLKRKEQI